MMLLSLTTGLLLSAFQGAPQTQGRVELWGGLYAGMSVEEVAAALQSNPGIKRADVKRDRKGRSSVSIKYAGRGVPIAGKNSEIVPIFAGDQLSAVRIVPVKGSFGLASCLRNGQAAFRYYGALLSQKYQRNHEPRPDFTDLFAAELRANRVSNPFYSLPVRKIIEGYTDGRVQVFNVSDLKAATDYSRQKGMMNLEYSLCGDDVGLYATPSLLYMTKAAADAALQANAQQQEQTIKSLSDDL